MFDKIAEYRKAIAAFLVPALTVLGAAALPDTDGVVRITLNEWIAVAIAALGTSVVVGAVRNEINPANVADPLSLSSKLIREANAREGFEQH